MAARYYSNTAVETTLAAGATSGATTITVSETTGFPATTPFTLAVDFGSGSEELVSVTEVAGTTLTVTRAFDSTAATAHSAGAVVKHVHSAADFRDSRQHEQANAGVHGVTGSVVGTSDAQTITNKTFDGSNTFPSSLATDAEVTAAVNAHANATAAHGVFGDVVGTTDSQTLSMKTITDCEILNSNWSSGSFTDPDIQHTAPWFNYTPTWDVATGTNPTLGNGTLVGRYRTVGRIVHFKINLTFGSTTALGSGVYRFTLPLAAREEQACGGARLNHDSSNYAGSVYIQGGETSACRVLHASGSVNHNSPFVFDAGDVINIQGTYESL